MSHRFSKLSKFSLSLCLSCSLMAAVLPSHAATIDLGGIRLRLPHVTLRRSDRTPTYRENVATTHPRWYVAVQEGRRFATNDQGFWIGYDERGEMVMQFELALPSTAAVNSPISVQFDVNGRFYDTIQGVLASDRIAVVHSNDAERVLGRLMSGSRVLINVAGNRIETHLRGSSDAIENVRRDAVLQRRAFAEGRVKVDEKPEDQSAIAFFLPGVKAPGKVEVRFDIVEDKGLVFYLNFSAIEGHGDPAYSMPLFLSEAKRTVAMIGKAADWTEVAKTNRVGLFSKRIGFVDDINGGPVPEPDDGSEESAATEPKKSTEIPSGSQGQLALSAQETAQPVSKTPPQDLKAVNFNSYEDGTTSVQVEHSVRGFSRRFNLDLGEAQELAASLEATIEYATFRLENRENNPEVKDELFQ